MQLRNGPVENARMRELINKAGPGFLRSDHGGQELRNLYQKQSLGFNPFNLDDFARACYLGDIDMITAAVTGETAPPLDGTITGFKFGYATLVVTGSQRLRATQPGQAQTLPHIETLDYLLSHGCPPDVPDICGLTALAHASMVPSNTGPALVRALIRGGSNIDHQDIYGLTPVTMAAMVGHSGAVDALMEAGARIDIPDADGSRLDNFYLSYGPQVVAVVRKWLRRRAGETAPLDDTDCANCGKSNDEAQLKQCSACHTIRYCSTMCQRNHWRMHKVDCRKFTPDNTVILKPFYSSEEAQAIPTAPMARKLFSRIDERIPYSHSRTAHQPSSYPKSVIIKIQIPISGGDMFVYTKKRDFVCHLRRQDALEAYDRIAGVIRSEGTSGLKGYFAANLLSRNELVVKVDQILGEQQF